MDKNEMLNVVTVVVWAVIFTGSAIYLGLVLMEHSLGDCVLYCFVIATLLLIHVARDKMRL
jgi:hypothetical protein